MNLTRIPAMLVATLLFATSPGFGGTWEADPWARSFPRACTPEVQKCLEKLEARLHLGIGIEQALLELHESDPACALLLRSGGLHGL
jgi:hypothetical protein